MRLLTLILSLLCINGFAGMPEELNEKIALEKRAEAGDLEAQKIVAFKYLKGEKPFIQNNVLALKWLKMAAEQDDTDAQCELGDIYSQKYLFFGVTTNYTEAARLYRLAAYKGNKRALSALGDCYYKGQGVSRNVLEAFAYKTLCGGTWGYFLNTEHEKYTVAGQKRAAEIQAQIEANIEARSKKQP